MSDNQSNIETLEQKALRLEKELLTAQQQIVKSENKAVTIKEKMDLINTHPDIAMMEAKMDYELRLARQLIASRAFPPSMTPEQAFVLIKAGEEMGMKPMEAMKKLYIVNGAVGFHGSGLVSVLTEKGVELEYTEETDKQVIVVAKYNGKIYKETVKDSDQILTKSKAMTFAKKNKMRFHGVRMIANFYLAHLTGSVIIWEQDDIEATKELQKGKDYFDVEELIINAQSLLELEQVMEDHKKVLTNPKHLNLLVLYGQTKKSFEL